MKYAISYVSTVAPELDEKEIDSILKFSKISNINSNITGILLYSKGNFFQVLEGEKGVLTLLYDRILKDTRHKDIIKLFGRDIEEQEFTGYEVRFISLDSRFKIAELKSYLLQVEGLNPAIKSSVKYILKKFSEGIN